MVWFSGGPVIPLLFCYILLPVADDDVIGFSELDSKALLADVLALGAAPPETAYPELLTLVNLLALIFYI